MSSDTSESLEELQRFLQLGARLDLKLIAAEHILLLTGSEEGLAAIVGCPSLLASLVSLMGDRGAPPVAGDAALSLVNVSADAKGASALIALDAARGRPPPLQAAPGHIALECLQAIFDPDSALADRCCMILSNITRNSHLVEDVVDVIDETALGRLIDVFTKTNYNKSGCMLHYLGPLLSNLSQSRRVREFLLDDKREVMQRLLSFIGYRGSLVRRGGVVGAIKNCCFEEDHHDRLLGEDVDILPSLLLPLAGNEEFDEEDNNKLPLDLQYLPTYKVREEDPDIRLMLIEALTQLTTKKRNREFIREKNAYVVLRELHKWEKDRKVLSACEHLVNILIRTEDEIGLDNLKDVDIPTELLQETIESE